MGSWASPFLLPLLLLLLLAQPRIGLAFLRRAWFNLDLLWVGALLAMGMLTVVI